MISGEGLLSVLQSPSLILFIVALFGAYLGLFAHFQFVAYLGFAAGACLCTLLPSKGIRALAISLLVLSTVGGVASKTESAFTDTIRSLPSSEVLLEGIVTDKTTRLDASTNLALHVTGWISDGKREPKDLNLNVGLFDAAALSIVASGDRVRIRGKIKRPERALFPGDFDAYLFALARGIHGRINLSDPFDLIVIEPQAKPSVFASIREQLRQNLQPLLTPRERALVLALILGDTSLFDDDQRLIYRGVGAGHLLAVSGLQVSLLALIFFAAMHLLLLFSPIFFLRYHARLFGSLLALIFVWFFVLLCGAPPSAVRAGAMATAMLIGFCVRRHVRLADSFGTAGLLTLLISPGSAIDPSFLLSYAAVFGLLLASAVLQKPIDSLEEDQENRESLVVRWSKSLVIASLCAGVLTLSISGQVFGQISIAGIPANILFVPIASLLQLPAIFAGVAAAFLNSSILAQVAASSAGILEAVCDGFYQYVGTLTALTFYNAFFTSLFFLGSLISLHALGSQKKFVFLGTGVSLCLLALLPNWLHPSGVRITVLPVGHGDASVFEFPSGAIMLVDGGGAWHDRSDPGLDIILPFLQRRGIRRIDVMALSHPDPDHIKGLFSVAKNIEVGTIWHSGFTDDHPLMTKLIALAQDKNIPLKSLSLSVPQIRVGEATIRALNMRAGNKLGTNDSSLVLMVCLAKDCALWPGDIEHEGESMLVGAHPILNASVVKAPHHGSKTSSTQAFVDATHPAHVVFSTDRDNLWGFPHSQVVNRWKDIGAQLWNTGVQGELTFWLTGHGVKVSSFRDESE